jgi:hypothetical protein
MKGVRIALVLLLVAVVAGCGNRSVITAPDVARSYVSALAEGGFPTACAMLAPATLRRLETTARARCARLLARCLPERSTTLNHDQSQLLYVNATTRVLGRRTYVHLSGLAVAREINAVTLISFHGRWLLTSPGQNVAACAKRFGRRRGRSRP